MLQDLKFAIRQLLKSPGFSILVILTLALGILRMVVKQGMTPVLIGLALGLAGSFAAVRLIAAQLYQVSPHNPLLLGTTAVALAVFAMLACLIPARRATRVNPIQALRAG